MDSYLYINLLMDFYGAMLTEHQRDTMVLHYSDDLSLAEIASTLNISRQAVHDTLKRGLTLLETNEDKLGLLKRYFEIESRLKEIRFLAENLDDLDIAKKNLIDKIDKLLNTWEG